MEIRVYVFVTKYFSNVNLMLINRIKLLISDLNNYLMRNVLLLFQKCNILL